MMRETMIKKPNKYVFLYSVQSQLTERKSAHSFCSSYPTRP